MKEGTGRGNSGGSVRLLNPKHILVAKIEGTRLALTFLAILRGQQAAVLDTHMGPTAYLNPFYVLSYVVGAGSLRARFLSISCQPGFALEVTSERHLQKPLLLP